MLLGKNSEDFEIHRFTERTLGNHSPRDFCVEHSDFLDRTENYFLREDTEPRQTCLILIDAIISPSKKCLPTFLSQEPPSQL